MNKTFLLFLGLITCQAYINCPLLIHMKATYEPMNEAERVFYQEYKTTTEEQHVPIRTLFANRMKRPDHFDYEESPRYFDDYDPKYLEKHFYEQHGEVPIMD